MPSGLSQTEIPEMLQSEDGARHVLDLEITSEPGTTSEYHDGNYISCRAFSNGRRG